MEKSTKQKKNLKKLKNLKIQSIVIVNNFSHSIPIRVLGKPINIGFGTANLNLILRLLGFAHPHTLSFHQLHFFFSLSFDFFSRHPAMIKSHQEVTDVEEKKSN
jgi:hypothetical protein